MRYFFDQDSDCHWYMLPERLRGLWRFHTENDIDPTDYASQEHFEELFGEYLLDGDISRYSFTDPQETEC